MSFYWAKKIDFAGRPKIESQQPKMPRTTSRPYPAARSFTQAQQTEFKQQFATFAPVAYQRYTPSSSVSDWARAEARNFHHDVNATVPFALTYKSLVAWAEQKQTQHQKQPSNTFAKDGQLTEQETKYGQKVLHGILYREYTNWWHAFAQEATEDTHSDMSASERFSLHCARILHTKSGIPTDHIIPFVEAWLIQKGQAE